MTYRIAAFDLNETREGYFILTATNATNPNPGMTKGYSIFYEGTSTPVVASTVQTSTLTSTSTPSSGLPNPPAAVRQVFDSFELIAVVAMVLQAEQAVSNQPDDLGEEPRGGGEEEEEEEEGGNDRGRGRGAENGGGGNGGEGRGGGNDRGGGNSGKGGG